jgi:RNA polymerase sigma-70 factor (ECF subfamily)
LINELPNDQREVVLMRMYYDMSFKEISEFTNVSINTSLGRMRYALFNLKKMIEERNLEVATG